MTKNAKSNEARKIPAGKFDNLLAEWQTGKNVAWGDLLAAWVEAPPAPRSPDMIVKIIRFVDAK